MSQRVCTGLERLLGDRDLQKSIKGNIGLLCHSASINRDYQSSIVCLQQIFGKRLIKLFGPQHGLFTNVQDNMIETDHMQHPYFKLPVYSLYSETRIPSDVMLENIDTLLVDLQDVGVRVYTYISTISLILKSIEGKDIELVVLDRPNPIGGDICEGNILEENFCSFVGVHPIPMRHGLTIGEFALYSQRFFYPRSSCRVISMINWKRALFFNQTGLPWAAPSPNLPTFASTLSYPGTVLLEGTNLSEGRGTTTPLEVLGHPKIEPYAFLDHIKKQAEFKLFKGVILRPIYFTPTFQKWQEKGVGGMQLHISDQLSYRPWSLCQWLIGQLYVYLGDDFKWNDKPYEYQDSGLSIDFINGSDAPRLWVEKAGPLEQLNDIANLNQKVYRNRRSQILLYL